MSYHLGDLNHQQFYHKSSNQTKAEAAENKDFLWKVRRIVKEKEQRIPGWSAFSAYVSMSDIPVATVQYMPLKRASPSDLSTIYTSLLQLTQLAEELGQAYSHNC